MTGVDRDILISRVIDGEASPEDWTAFKALAARDQSIWGELAEAQQDHAELSAAVDGAIDCAEAVEAPVEADLGERLTYRVRVLTRWGGWVAAGVVAMMWASSAGLLPAGTGGQQAGLVPAYSSPDDALDYYLNEGRSQGRVLDATPSKVVREVQPHPDGGFVVYYSLVIPERAVVERVYTPGVNEFGQPVGVPMRPLRADPARKPM